MELKVTIEKRKFQSLISSHQLSGEGVMYEAIKKAANDAIFEIFCINSCIIESIYVDDKSSDVTVTAIINEKNGKRIGY